MAAPNERSGKNPFRRIKRRLFSGSENDRQKELHREIESSREVTGGGYSTRKGTIADHYDWGKKTSMPNFLNSAAYATEAEVRILRSLLAYVIKQQGDGFVLPDTMITDIENHWDLEVVTETYNRTVKLIPVPKYRRPQVAPTSLHSQHTHIELYQESMPAISLDDFVATVKIPPNAFSIKSEGEFEVYEEEAAPEPEPTFDKRSRTSRGRRKYSQED